MEWTCDTCTFINEGARNHCSLCDTRKPQLPVAVENEDLEIATGSPPITAVQPSAQDVPEKEEKKTEEPKTDEKTSPAMLQKLASILYSQIVRYKMVLIERTDLKMGKGKIAAQCCHGCLGAFKIASATHPNEVYRWTLTGSKKVVLKCKSEEELVALESKARELRIPCCLVQDAGSTQVASGSKTVLALGPLQASLIDPVTKDLKLL